MTRPVHPKPKGPTIRPHQPDDLAAACRRLRYDYLTVTELAPDGETGDRERTGRSQRWLSIWRPQASHAPRNQQPIVVLGHGTGNDRFYPQRHLIEALMAAGFAVASIDLPGHGRSHRDLFSLPNLESCWPRTFATLDHHGFGPVIAVGHSLSAAMLAVSVAGGSESPDKATGDTTQLAGAILLAPPFSLEIGGVAVINELLYSVAPAVIAQVPRYGLWGILPALGWFKRRQFPIRLAAGGSYVAVVTAFLAHVQPRARNSEPVKPAVPSLIISGGKDAIASADDGARWAAWLGSEQLVIRRANHFSLPFQNATVAAILKFCQRIAAPKPSGNQAEHRG